MRDHEHHLQTACVGWFRIQYPELATVLFAVPNGGARNEITGARLKDEGVTAGVADLLLLVANGTHHGLAIEMKTKTGRQSSEQGLWQLKVEKFGYKYAVCRSLDDFIATVEGYLNQSGESPRPVGEAHD